MDFFTLLPSPPHLLRLALSLLNLLNSTFGNHHSRALEHRPTAVDFDVDFTTGFFPRQALPRLPSIFELWEKALEEAGEFLSLGEDDSQEAVEKRVAGEEWRTKIKSWPVLNTAALSHDKRHVQRAHMVLAWLVHFFVHSMPPAAGRISITVPRSLAIPLVEISRALGIAPVLTFADVVLWNWELIDSDHPVSIENMRFLNVFSGTEDERQFYVASARAELRGVEALRIIEEYHSLPNVDDLTSVSKVSRDLSKLATVIDDISEIIQSVRATCDPHVFYWEIRPWFEGSNAKGPDGPTWIYEGVSGHHKLDLSGPSAGQSSVMHSLDIFLDVDHKLKSKRYPKPSEANSKADRGFMERMRRYMPGKHRAYLENLASTPRPLRDLALRTPALREPYDSTVMALKKLRDLHMRIACRYIVSMARSTPATRSGCPVSAMLDKMDALRASGQGPVRGTGGNQVSMLLKAGRDATRRTLLKEC